MTIKSLPDRPLTRAEGDKLAEKSNGRLIPDTAIEDWRSGAEAVYVSLISLNENGVRIVGYHPDEGEWDTIATHPIEASIDESYELIDEWVSETFDGEGREQLRPRGNR